MRRILLYVTGAALVTSFATAPALANPVAGNEKLRCDQGSALCAEPVDSIGYDGKYTGHDEPATIFYSNRPGSGTNQHYRLTIPRDSLVPPKQDGTGGTFTFQTRVAFWFGLALCDNQS